jgi:hypothetical protein
MLEQTILTILLQLISLDTIFLFNFKFLVLADMNIHRLPLTTINLIREALEQSPMVELIPNKEVVSLMVVEVKFVTKQF